MELMIDSANLTQIKESLLIYNISGVTTNLSLIIKENQKKLLKLLEDIKHVIGGRQMHVQVTENTWEKMVSE